MNASKILAAAALSLLAAAGAQAETYEGVLTVNSGVSRSEVAPQAVAAARAGNQYSEGASAGAQPFTSTAAPSTATKCHKPTRSPACRSRAKPACKPISR